MIALPALALIGVWFVLTNPLLSQSPQHSSHTNQTVLRNHVTFLAGITPTRSSQNIRSLNIAADYIEKSFSKTDCKVSLQPYLVGGIEYRNIVCAFNPEAPKRLVVGAHYDSFEATPGADDNASGVAGILELARIVNEQQPNLEYGIDFVAFTLEEPPHFARETMGSAVYANRVASGVFGMISVEMIGYFSDIKNSQQLPAQGVLEYFYPTTGNYISMIGRIDDFSFLRKAKSAFNRSSPLPVYSMNAPVFVEPITFSDHRSFWAAGYPAIMVTDTSFFRNKNYHKVSDTPDTLDYARMKQVVDGLYGVITQF